ncbi:MAG: hypothetical protein ACFFC1_20165, partial [Promethearchaeota archaeon]
TDNLIEQQFYKSGNDTIIGRTPEISIKIKNSGLIVKRFKNIFYNNLHLFLEGDYLKFLSPFEQIKGMDENYLKEIYQEIQIKLTAMHDTKIDSLILYTVVVSSLISRIRDIQFNEALEEINRRIKKKSNNLSYNQMQIVLDNLYMENNKYVSILYNIVYLDALAESFNFKKVARICKIQKGKYMNKIADLILSSYSGVI